MRDIVAIGRAWFWLRLQVDAPKAYRAARAAQERMADVAAVARAVLEPDRPVREHPCSMRPPRPSTTAATVPSPSALAAAAVARELRDVMVVLVDTDPGGFAEPERQAALRRARELVGS